MSDDAQRGPATVATATGFGGPEVLVVERADPGPPGPREVRVAVRAIGVNPADAKRRAGRFGGTPPVRLGSEAAGVVVATGEGVTRAAVGDEVIVFRAAGAYASELLAPEGSLTPKPASLGWEQAAGLLLAGTTAVHALEATGVGEGDTVLVHGAAGGVGQMVIQLAAMRGVRVIGTAGAEGSVVVEALGGEAVRYGPGLGNRVRDLAPGGVSVALDLVGTPEALEVSLEAVADRARIATIVPRPEAFEAGVLVLGGGGVRGDEIRDAARADLARLAGEGLLTVTVAASFPLERVADAHRLLEGGHVHGKIVLIP